MFFWLRGVILTTPRDHPVGLLRSLRAPGAPVYLGPLCPWGPCAPSAPCAPGPLCPICTGYLQHMTLYPFSCLNTNL